MDDHVAAPQFARQCGDHSRPAARNLVCARTPTEQVRAGDHGHAVDDEPTIDRRGQHHRAAGLCRVHLRPTLDLDEGDLRRAFEPGLQEPQVARRSDDQQPPIGQTILCEPGERTRRVTPFHEPRRLRIAAFDRYRVTLGHCSLPRLVVHQIGSSLAPRQAVSGDQEKPRPAAVRAFVERDRGIRQMRQNGDAVLHRRLGRPTDFDAIDIALAKLRHRVVVAKPRDDTLGKLDPHGMLAVRRKDVDHAPAQRDLTRFVNAVIDDIADLRRNIGKRVDVDRIADSQPRWCRIEHCRSRIANRSRLRRRHEQDGMHLAFRRSTQLAQGGNPATDVSRRRGRIVPRQRVARRQMHHHRIGREGCGDRRNLRRALIVGSDADHVALPQPFDDRYRYRPRGKGGDAFVDDLLTDLKHRYASFFRHST